MRKLILLALVTVAAALAVSVGSAKAVLPPGGGGTPCYASGALVDNMPYNLGGAAYVDCPNYPGASVKITVCIQKLHTFGWSNVDCQSNAGLGYIKAVAAFTCGYTTYVDEFRLQGIAYASGPFGTVSAVTTSPVAYGKCWV